MPPKTNKPAENSNTANDLINEAGTGGQPQGNVNPGTDQGTATTNANQGTDQPQPGTDGTLLTNDNAGPGDTANVGDQNVGTANAGDPNIGTANASPENTLDSNKDISAQNFTTGDANLSNGTGPGPNYTPPAPTREDISGYMEKATTEELQMVREVIDEEFTKRGVSTTQAAPVLSEEEQKAKLQESLVKQYGENYVFAEHFDRDKKKDRDGYFSRTAWNNMGPTKDGWQEVVPVPDEVKNLGK